MTLSNVSYMRGGGGMRWVLNSLHVTLVYGRQLISWASRIACLTRSSCCSWRTGGWLGARHGKALLRGQLLQKVKEITEKYRQKS